MVTKTFDFLHDVFELFLLFKEEPHLFFLDSSLTASTNGRYSMIGFDPFDLATGDSLESYQKFKDRFKSFSNYDKDSDLPFSNGAVGYLSYDLGMLLQGIPLKKERDETLPLFYFGLYDVILVVDHLEQKLHVVSSGLPEQSPELRKKRAAERLKKVEDALGRLDASGYPYKRESLKETFKTPHFQSNVTKEEYIDAVKRALDHIHQGDIYEINLSHQITVQERGEILKLKPWEIYACLRELSPSHFSAFFNTGTHQILSTSPERFLCLKNKTAQIRPMKGTRPRGRTPEEDSVLRQELLHSSKEIAELLMVTDLERNDLGRVCEFTSIRVKEMRTIEEYKTVFQATSTVEGTLQSQKDSFDLLEACFPGGSVTGCPKISAMNIIAGIEKGRRGIYTGAFGYIDFSGDLDFNILIRTLVLNEKKISFHVGGGIVSDSDPLMEYDETWLKAKALMECLTICPTRRAL